MKRLACLCALTLALLAQCPVGGGPVVSRYKAAPAEMWEQRSVESGSSLYVQDNFKGGERASVIVIGGYKDMAMELAVYVFDANGNCVARFDEGADYCAVEWYPPTTGRYLIEVRNRGNGSTIRMVIR
jgi:hypothetical protein